MLKDNLKYCPRCYKAKPVTKFYRDKSRRGGGLSSYCKSCCRNKAKEPFVAHSLCIRCNKSVKKGVKRCPECAEKVEQKRRWTLKSALKSAGKKYKALIKSGGCCVCGYSKCISALDFHHVNGVKLADMSKLNTVSRIKKEILETNLIVMCSNCHRELHAGMIDEDTLLEYVLTC